MKRWLPGLRHLAVLLAAPVGAACVASAAFASAAVAQGGWWSFEGRGYYDPLVAGVREAQVAAAVGYASAVAFQVEPGDPRPSWDIDVGAELPLFGWESRRGEGPYLPAGAFGVGVWLPIDFHMIEDFVDDSNPILNTDYRFGPMVKAQWGLASDARVGARLFAGHESTHLGDEFSIRGQAAHPGTFERINVSWEFLDVGALYGRITGETDWSVRGGLVTTLPFGDSYYSTDPESVTSSPVGPVTASSNWIDPYAGGDAEREWLRWAGYASAEIRWRTIYDYHKADASASEDRKLSTNLIVGVRRTGTTELGRASLFARFYHGVNPHGQFRNQADFTFLGIGLRLVR